MEWFNQPSPPASDDEGDFQLYWEIYRDSLACSCPDRTGDVRTVTQPSDFYSVRQRRSTTMHSEFFRPAGMEHDMLLCLPAGHMRTVRLKLRRGPGPDSSGRDRALLMLPRPHLQQAYLDAEQAPPQHPPAHPRQRELLHLVAAGHTNAPIARRLGVTEKTVGKHPETSTPGSRYPAAQPL